MIGSKSSTARLNLKIYEKFMQSAQVIRKETTKNYDETDSDSFKYKQNVKRMCTSRK
jgi:hypothetical protein